MNKKFKSTIRDKDKIEKIFDNAERDGKEKNILNKEMTKSPENQMQQTNVENDSLINSLSLDKKKITIRDLCPEEKQKIGELLKKLAEEKEEKEKLMKVIDDEKKIYESKIDSILKEKENLSTSQFNNSLYIKNESFMNESLIPQNCEKIEINCNSNTNTNTNSTNKKYIFSDVETLTKGDCNLPQVELKNLKEKFNKLFDTLKKTAQNHDEYFNKYSNTIAPESDNINTSTSLLREERPLVLHRRPIPIDTENSKNLNYNFEDNILQTSIININDDIRESNTSNNFFSESKIIIYNK
jgi:hypothetical protein